MKPGYSASVRSKIAQEMRKPGPVRRLSPDEVKALEHQRNLSRYLTQKQPVRNPDRTRR